MESMVKTEPAVKTEPVSSPASRTLTPNTKPSKITTRVEQRELEKQEEKKKEEERKRSLFSLVRLKNDIGL